MLHFPKMQHFGKIPKNVGQNLAKNQKKNLTKFAKLCKKSAKEVSNV